MSVVVVITCEAEALALAGFGRRLARALEKRLVVLWVRRGDADGTPLVLRLGEDPLPADAEPTVAALCAFLATAEPPPEPGGGAAEPQETADEAADDTVPPLAEPEVEVRALVCRSRMRTVLAQAEAVAASFLVAIKYAGRSGRRGYVSLGRKLFTAAPCHTILMHLGEVETVHCGRILVPTAGGHHASEALRLADRLTRAERGSVVALYVEPEAGELAREVGERILDRAVAAAGVGEPERIERRVELADRRADGIRRVAEEGCDLLLLGASNVGTLRSQLFGTLPARLLGGAHGTVVAVVRRRWSLMDRLRWRLGRWLDLVIPQMSRDERIKLYETLQSGSVWSFDFMTLIALSTAIAALGLIQSSGAVVIGAMLVAPLMTPILGAGLALVQGNAPLLRNALRSIVYGYLMALGIGVAIGAWWRAWGADVGLTAELAARGGPSPLDLGVAFLSGLAAAYCLGRPGLVAALPGVAIAAALVPPIATTGVALAIGERGAAAGAALLFGTNVVAIVLGAAVSLYGGGVRGKRGASRRQRWVRFGFVGLLVGVVGLAAALSAYAPSRLGGRISPALRARLVERVEVEPGMVFERVVARRERGRELVAIEVRGPRAASPALVASLARLVREELGADQAVRVGSRLAIEAE